jgi:AcrR family transcriptional regulator
MCTPRGPIDDVSSPVVVSMAMTARASATAKKRAYHHGDLSRALLAAALEIIATRGPEAFTLREVAATVGVTHGAAYRHFADKEALLAAVAEEGYRALARKLASSANAAADADAPERVRALAAGYIEFAMAHPAQYRVMWGPRVNEDGRFPSLETAIADAFALVIAEFERGQASGAFRDEPARDLAVAFWVAAHGYVELVLRRRLKVKSEAVAVAYFAKLLAPFFDGLTIGRATRGRGKR